MDKCKVTDRDAVHIPSATVEAIGKDPADFLISRLSVQRSRQRLRKKITEKIQKYFANVNLSAVVIHWDGKLLPSLTGNETVDRLPVILTSGDTEKLLSVSTGIQHRKINSSCSL